jgi:hypothetical protein
MFPGPNQVIWVVLPPNSTAGVYVLSKLPVVVKSVSLSHTSSGCILQVKGPKLHSTDRDVRLSPGLVVGELLNPRILVKLQPPKLKTLPKETVFPEPVTSMVVVPVAKKSTGTANAACPASSARAVHNSNFLIEYVPPFQFPYAWLA